MLSVVLMPTSSKKSCTPEFHHVNQIVLELHIEGKLSMFAMTTLIVINSSHLTVSSLITIILTS